MRAPNSSKSNVLAFMGRAFRYRNYRLFFGGQLISLIGTWIAMTATSWLVYRLTHSAFLLGLVSFCGQFPAFLFAPFAGLIIDRHSRHRILLVTQTLSMVQSFTMAALTLSHRITIPWLIVLSAFQALVNAFDLPCRQAFVVDMIEKREDLGNAIALTSSMFNVARLVGPAVGGMLIAAVGEGFCFLVDGVSYLAVIASLSAMAITRASVHARPDAGAKAFLEGLKYAAQSRPIRSLIAMVALISLLGVPYTVLMPVFAGTVLGGGPHTLGFLMAATGIGALVGALWLASRETVLGLGRIIAIATATFGAGLIAFSCSRSLWLALLFLVIAGGGFMVQMAGSNTILQTIVDDDKRGRVMSLFIMAFMGTAPFGSLLSGALSQRIGVPRTLLMSGVCCLGGALWFKQQLPELREAVRPIYKRLGILPEVARGIGTVAARPPEE